MDASQLKQRMAQLPPPITDKRPPYWDYWRLELYNRVLTDDPRRFCNWPCIYHTMCQAHWPFSIDHELFNLDLNRWHYAIQMPHFGADSYSNNTQYSMNLIHQAYHLTQWEKATGKRIEHLDTIVEFGGGYGAMALLCRRIGFEGQYVIYDLPEFSLLQEYYLSQFGLLDKTEWNPVKKPKDVDLFMALYSLSEVEPDKRYSKFCRSKSFLFLYSGKWEKWNNAQFFQDELPNTWPLLEMTWQHSEITHLPDRNNWYSIGW